MDNKLTLIVSLIGPSQPQTKYFIMDKVRPRKEGWRTQVQQEDKRNNVGQWSNNL